MHALAFIPDHLDHVVLCSPFEGLNSLPTLAAQRSEYWVKLQFLVLQNSSVTAGNLDLCLAHPPYHSFIVNLIPLYKCHKIIMGGIYRKL